MTSSSLIQYFRSFIIKLNMIEAQIGQLYLGGKSHLFCLPTHLTGKSTFIQDDISFAIVIELKDDASPSHSDTAVCINMLEYLIVAKIYGIL
jgi:mitotic spindle assembly checkpoint protein MAD2B